MNDFAPIPSSNSSTSPSPVFSFLAFFLPLFPKFTSENLKRLLSILATVFSSGLIICCRFLFCKIRMYLCTSPDSRSISPTISGESTCQTLQVLFPSSLFRISDFGQYRVVPFPVHLQILVARDRLADPRYYELHIRVPPEALQVRDQVHEIGDRLQQPLLVVLLGQQVVGVLVHALHFLALVATSLSPWICRFRPCSWSFVMPVFACDRPSLASFCLLSVPRHAHSSCFAAFHSPKIVCFWCV